MLPYTLCVWFCYCLCFTIPFQNRCRAMPSKTRACKLATPGPPHPCVVLPLPVSPTSTWSPLTCVVLPLPVSPTSTRARWLSRRFSSPSRAVHTGNASRWLTSAWLCALHDGRVHVGVRRRMRAKRCTCRGNACCPCCSLPDSPTPRALTFFKADSRPVPYVCSHAVVPKHACMHAPTQCMALSLT